MDQIRILIADDHEVVRHGLNTMLGRQADMLIVGEAANGREMIELTKALQPDIILADIEMPVLNGIEATRVVTAECPLSAVIALSMFDDMHYVLDMLEAGARGYLLKNTAKAEMLQAIRSVHNNESYYNAEIARKIPAMFVKDPEEYKLRNEVKFSVREKEVLEYICMGYTSKQIAEELNLSNRTVEWHREALHQKTNTPNVVALVIYALRNKLYLPK